MSNEAARAFWDSRAEDRDQRERQPEFVRLAALYEEACWRAIEPILPPAGSVVLEAGCGTGRWVWRLAQRGLKTMLLDFSPEMVQVAARRVAERGLQDSVAGFHVQDICDMHELADQGVDCVICLGEPLGLCDDPRRAAAEMYRVLRPDGTLVCDAANRLRMALDLARDNDWTGAETMFTQGVRRSDDGRPHWGFTDIELCALFGDAGFAVDRVTATTPLVCFPPTPELLTALTDDAVFERVQNLFERMEQDPSVVGVSARLLVAARKKLPV